MQDLADNRTQSLVLSLLADDDSDVRYQAVNAIPIPEEHNVPDDHPVVQGLLRAMEDPDDLVRDWATMHLGMVDTNTPAVRDAFARHLRDPGEDTAGEAARALAARGDKRVKPVLQEQLADPEVRYLFVFAAKELADPTLLPLLLQLQASGWPHDDDWSFVLTDAIQACSASKNA
jgi:HEAT repeat protein